MEKNKMEDTTGRTGWYGTMEALRGSWVVRFLRTFHRWYVTVKEVCDAAGVDLTAWLFAHGSPVVAAVWEASSPSLHVVVDAVVMLIQLFG